ncbi:hypothetical protein GUJ93_ZPchr0009g2083 [Zizania palustris]|uniref:Uncharacterized protein n=1 Tax=Zizania palustris TaxID=103762 RepID=A0A8J5S6M3_ZIZPA|nr:hypothetical protein GUJ93_ZPchr0009g2083 [Zizania palustris]
MFNLDSFEFDLFHPKSSLRQLSFFLFCIYISLQRLICCILLPGKTFKSDTDWILQLVSQQILIRRFINHHLQNPAQVSEAN